MSDPNHHSPHDPPSASPAGEAPSLRFRERARLGLGSSDLLVFVVGRERFGVELRAVDELVERPAAQMVPEAPPGLLGIFDLRGHLMPLFSPAHVLGPTATECGVALVMRSGARRIGLAVDDVEDVVTVSLSGLREAPAGVNDDEVIAGLIWNAGHLITVLDARTLVGACASLTLPNAA